MKLRGLLLGLLVAGCAPAVEEAEDEEIVVGSAYSAFSTSALKWLNGTYYNCSNRSGAWSARVSGAGAMDNPALTVVKNDAACQLVLTGVVADQTYAASPAIVLETTYAASATTFGSGGSAFSGNAKLDSISFSSDFQLTFVYEDRATAPVVSESTINATYTTVTTSSVTASSVVPPNYQLNTTALKFGADPVLLTYSVTGSASLHSATTTGNTYVIEGSLSANPTFDEVKNAYNLNFLGAKSISGQPQNIPAADFGVVTLGLLPVTIVKNIIVRRNVGGTYAYQVFRVTFSS